MQWYARHDHSMTGDYLSHDVLEDHYSDTTITRAADSSPRQLSHLQKQRSLDHLAYESTRTHMRVACYK